MLIIIVRPTVQPTTGHHHNNLATIRIGFPTVLYPTGNCDSLWITFRLLPRALSASVRLVVEHSWSGLWQRKVLVTLYEALASNLLFCNCDGSFLMEYSLLTSCWDVLQTFSCMPSEIVDDLWWHVVSYACTNSCEIRACSCHGWSCSTQENHHSFVIALLMFTSWQNLSYRSAELEIWLVALGKQLSWSWRMALCSLVMLSALKRAPVVKSVCTLILPEIGRASCRERV